MSEKVRVEKINIVIGDITVALELEDAKELQKLLNDLFGAFEGDKTIYVPSPYPVYPCPVYPYPEPYYPYERWGVWGGDTYIDNSTSTPFSGTTITYSLSNTQN